MKIEELYQFFLTCSGVGIDTRNIEQNSMFFALKGENFDANVFTQEALNKGAKFAVIDNKEYYTDEDKMFLVSDVLKTLQDLAQYHREQLGLTVIALTGTNGKTTTKELINNVLSKKYNVLATQGNLNNHIGVPLTLLKITEDNDLAIIEMGANHQGEIAFLTNIVQPDFGYITNFGKAHLEGFGGFEGVVKTKSELYDYLRKNDKYAFVNADDNLQIEKSDGIKTYTFAIENNNVLYKFKKEDSSTAEISYGENKIKSNLTGDYNISNISVATAIGLFFNVDIKDIQSAISNYHPTNNRSQWVNTKENKILLDAYNANPSSMQASLDNFIKIKSEDKLAILGDMFELGRYTDAEHKHIIQLVEDNRLNAIFIGKHFYNNKNDNHLFFNTFEEASNHLSNNIIRGKTILIKGSRGMFLERLLNKL